MPMTRRNSSFAVSLTMLSLLSTAVGQTATWVPIRQTTNENGGGTFSTGRMLVADDARNLLVSFGCHLAAATTADTWVWAGSHWSPRDPSRVPARRSDAMFVYDAGRRVVVMFGGTVANSVWVDETWEFDGMTWLLRSLPVRPPARFLTAGAYDRTRARVVLYGGGQGPLLSDTWEYDGNAWIQRTPASNPGPRQRHRMAYDEARQVVVMHGGEYAYNQTWEWDGTNWSLRSSSGPNLYDFGMAYDRARQRTVAIGSQAFLGSSTFEWDGVNWITGASPPPPDHQGEGLATDPLSGRALLFRDSRLWQWNGLAWTQLAQVEIAPTGLRPQQVWCTDSVRQRVVMHTSSESFLFSAWEGTWEWNGRRWQRLSPGPKRLYAAMAFDVARQRSVLFGGFHSSVGTTDRTHEWDGNVWVEASPSARPPARYQAAMAYDAARQCCVLFGGAGPTTPWPLPGPPPVNLLGDTWTYDGVTWTQRAGGPPDRCCHAMAYDEVRQVVVLFGGASATQVLSDTWEWNGTSWTQRFPLASPSVSALASMVFDPVRGVVVLHDSEATGLDMWTYDGVTWAPLPTTGVRVRSSQEALAFDPENQVLMLHGGGASSGSSATTMVREGALLWSSPVAPVAVGFGTGCGTGVVPRLRAPLAYPGHVDFAFEVDQVANGALVVLGLAFTQATQSLGPCTLYLGGTDVLVAGLANSYGVVRFALPIAPGSSLIGLNLTSQAAVLANPGAFLGLDFTGGHALTIGR
jgi:hypothetical protein